MEQIEENAPHTLRYHRFDKWRKRADELFEQEDFDTAFILYWIAFNSLYSSLESLNEKAGEKHQHHQFFYAIHQVDDEGKIYDVVWDNYGQLIRNLMHNQYVYEPFWDYQRTKDTGQAQHTHWKAELKEQNKQVQIRLTHRTELPGVFQLIFDRLYVLRNQLIHGNATHSSSMNREQVKSGAMIMNTLLPVIGDVFNEHPNFHWGAPLYPPISD